MIDSTQQHAIKAKSKVKRYRYITAGIALVFVVALVTVFIMKAQPLQAIDGSKYQVVYLTNGQAYFGKLQNTDGDFLVMKTPYIAQSVASSDEKSADTTQTTLLKVTDQVYGPDDSIAIKSDQVAFWQNLRDDSKVAQAIKAKE